MGQAGQEHTQQLVATVSNKTTLLHRFLLFLGSLVSLRLAFVLEEDRGRSRPLALREELQGNHVLVDGSVEVLETLDENLVGDGRLSDTWLTWAKVDSHTSVPSSPAPWTKTAASR